MVRCYSTITVLSVVRILLVAVRKAVHLAESISVVMRMTVVSRLVLRHYAYLGPLVDVSLSSEDSPSGGSVDTALAPGRVVGPSFLVKQLRLGVAPLSRFLGLGYGTALHAAE